MARIRTIKPELFKSATIDALNGDTPVNGDTAVVMFIGLLTYADDEGRGVDDPYLLRAELFPRREVPIKAVEAMMTDLKRVGLLTRYQVGKYRYFAITNFSEHQVINKPTKSKLPAPPDHEPPGQEALPADSRSAPVVVQDDYRQEREREREMEREKELLASNAKISEPEVALVESSNGSQEAASKQNDRPAITPIKPGRDERNRLWDAVAQVCRVDVSAMPKSARSGFAKVVNEIADIGAMPDEVFAKGAAYRMAYPDAALTPHALAKHWANVEGVATQPKVDKHELELQRWVASRSEQA